MISSIDRTRLVNLKVVARLQRGQKLKTRKQYFEIDDNSSYMPQWITRMLSEETKEHTLFSLSDLITSCTNANVLKKEEIPLVIDELINASEGICNLIATYIKFSTTMADLITTLQQIFGFIKKHGTSENELTFKRKCSVLETIVPGSMLSQFRLGLIEEEIVIDTANTESIKDDVEYEVTVDMGDVVDNDIETGIDTELESTLPKNNKKSKKHNKVNKV